MAKLDRILDRFDLRTVESAVARRRMREKQVRALAERRRKLEAELAKLTTRMSGRSNGHSKSARGSAATKERKPNARRMNDITLAEALEKVMKAKRSPMHYKDLTTAVVSRHLYRTKSKNLLSTVAVTLMRDRRFRKVKPGVYSLR
jgi:HB1, ASXL, restriction endonuclease HTH domain